MRHLIDELCEIEWEMTRENDIEIDGERGKIHKTTMENVYDLGDDGEGQNESKLQHPLTLTSLCCFSLLGSSSRGTQRHHGNCTVAHQWLMLLVIRIRREDVLKMRHAHGRQRFPYKPKQFSHIGALFISPTWQPKYFYFLDEIMCREMW